MSTKPDQFMPLFIGDYLRDTTRLTSAEHGSYLLLLMDEWVNGPPPDDDRVLASITRNTPAAWRRIRVAVAAFFVIDDGRWVQRRLERERGRSTKLYEAKREAGRIGGTAARGKSGRKRIAEVIANVIAEPIPNELQKNSNLQPTLVPLPEVGNGRLHAAADPPKEASPARPAKPDPWKEVYDYGKGILGPSSGGVITNLRKTFGERPKKVMGKLEDASKAERPLEWINAFLWEHGPAGIQVGAIG